MSSLHRIALRMGAPAVLYALVVVRSSGILKVVATLSNPVNGMRIAI